MILPSYKTPPRTKAVALKRIRKLIALGWTQGVLARNKYGCVTSPESASAVCVCLDGAMVRAHASARIFQGVIPHESVVAYNDTPGRTLDEVLDYLDDAIARETAK